MTERSMDLPQECWELVFNFLHHHRHFESLSLVCTRFLSITDHLRGTLTISSQAVPLLPRLFERFPNVKVIDIREFNGDLNSLLNQISRSGLDLETLGFSNQNHFPLMGLRDLSSSMRNLRKLNCSKIGSLEDIHLFAIGMSFPFLEDLDISFPQYNSRFNPIGSLDLQNFSGVVTDEGIVDLARKVNKLRRIDLSGNHFITDKSLQALSLNCVLLSEVVVRDCDFITQNGISFVMRNSANLNSISLDGIGIPSIDSSFLESFTYAKTLCELHLSNSFISDDLLCLVAEASLPLKKLIIAQCYNFSFVGVSCLLYRYQFLEHLDLEGANFLNDASMVEMSNFLLNLSFINLSSCSKLTSLTIFALIRNCPLMEDVRMERTNLGVEAFMGDLVINCRVKSLKLGGNNNLSDECLKKAAFCCPSLQVLDISYCPTITEEGLKEVLRHSGEIRHLEMNRCMGIKNLDLNFELPKLEVLQVQGPGMDDEALVVIAKRCQKLLHLDLEGCLNVTAKGVKEVVQNCTRLREINLRWCYNINVDIVARMVFARPSLRRIVPPCGFTSTDNQKMFFLRHGCLICKG